MVWNFVSIVIHAFTTSGSNFFPASLMDQRDALLVREWFSVNSPGQQRVIHVYHCHNQKKCFARVLTTLRSAISGGSLIPYRRVVTRKTDMGPASRSLG